MEGRRVRRFGRAPRQNQTLLPLQRTRLSNTVSCWYCDFKSTVLNDPLFRFGRKYSRFLQVWFSVGTGFSLAALFGVLMILLWELGKLLHLYHGNFQLGSLYNGSLFWFSSTIIGSIGSLSDVGYICISSIVSVFVHEAGHALAAASEGIQMEYIAIFWAVVFPGALVALNNELLQSLSRAAALRVYCAGIWHNAAACFICALALFLLPLILDPFYLYGDCPMVLNVSPTSPLSTYLSPHDLVISLSGFRIHSVHEWKEAIAVLNAQKVMKFHNSSDFTVSGIHIRDEIGYCVPRYLVKGGNMASCSDEFYAFSVTPCVDEANNKNDFSGGQMSIHCFNPEDVIKLKRCGPTVCSCSEDESCFAPVQTRGQVWVEISYLRIQGCPNLKGSVREVESVGDYKDTNCSQSFVFVGDVISLERSLELTSYRPRWPNAIATRLPNVLEKLLICTFHVSLALALFNSLPVYFLDGECILEMMLQYIGLSVIKTREKVLRWFLLIGSIISLLFFLRNFTLL